MNPQYEVASAVRRALLISAVSAAGFTAPVMAQDAEEAADSLDTVVVTGSRIRQPNLTTTSPVTRRRSAMALTCTAGTLLAMRVILVASRATLDRNASGWVPSRYFWSSATADCRVSRSCASEATRSVSVT